MLDILLCLIDIHAWVVCVLTLAFNQDSGTSTLSLENLEEIVQSPSPGIRLHSLVILGVLAK